MSLLVGIGFEDKKIFIEYKGEHFTFDESITKEIFKDMKEQYEPDTATIPLKELSQLEWSALGNNTRNTVYKNNKQEFEAKFIEDYRKENK